MGEIESNERLLATYGDAALRMQTARDEAIRRARVAMESTSGWLAAAAAAAAQSVLEATRGECNVQVARLLEAHAEGGDVDPTRVAEAVRARFLGALEPPGRQFVEKRGPEAREVGVVAVRHAAEFEAERDRVAHELEDRFRALLEARRSPGGRLDVFATTPAASRGKVWSLTESRPLLVFLIVTLLLSLAGVSWLDVFRRAGALL